MTNGTMASSSNHHHHPYNTPKRTPRHRPNLDTRAPHRHPSSYTGTTTETKKRETEEMIEVAHNSLVVDRVFVHLNKKHDKHSKRSSCVYYGQKSGLVTNLLGRQAAVIPTVYNSMFWYSTPSQVRNSGVNVINGVTYDREKLRVIDGPLAYNPFDLDPNRQITGDVIQSVDLDGADYPKDGTDLNDPNPGGLANQSRIYVKNISGVFQIKNESSFPQKVELMWLTPTSNVANSTEETSRCLDPLTYWSNLSTIAAGQIPNGPARLVTYSKTSTDGGAESVPGAPGLTYYGASPLVYAEFTKLWHPCVKRHYILQPGACVDIHYDIEVHKTLDQTWVMQNAPQLMKNTDMLRTSMQLQYLRHFSVVPVLIQRPTVVETANKTPQAGYDTNEATVGKAKLAWLDGFKLDWSFLPPKKSTSRVIQAVQVFQPERPGGANTDVGPPLVVPNIIADLTAGLASGEAVEFGLNVVDKLVQMNTD